MSRDKVHAVIGALLWLFFVVASDWDWAARLLLLAPLVHVPLAMHLVRPTRESRLWSRLQLAWPPAAFATAVSFALDTGAPAGALACIWLGFTAGLALYGAKRLFARGLRNVAELTIDAGLLMLPVGGAWLVAWRLDMTVMGFSDIWVLLTAVHFHYAAFLLPIIVGSTFRPGEKTLPPPSEAQVGGFRRATPEGGPARVLTATAIIAGIPLTAIGIATNQTVEFAAAALLVIGAVAFAAQLARRAAFAFSALALAAGMVLAGGYAAATTFGFEWLDLQQMIAAHGSLNAVAFALLALLLLVRADPRPASGVDDVDFSALRGDFTIGADFFDRVGAAVPGEATGLVDRLEELDGPDFVAGEVADEIRDFYEDTRAYDLDVEAHWKWWFAWAGRTWHRVAVRMEQTVFPVGGNAVADERVVASEIVSLDPAADGRPNPRAWVRTFDDTGKAMYAAAYSTHRHDDVAYMNIAFPMWRSNMASVLVPENLGSDGLRLDTETTSVRPHAGIWQVTNLGPIRLPLREYIDVWVADAPERPDDLQPRGAPMVARHVLTACGVRYLTLDYRMRRTAREHPSQKRLGSTD